MTDLFRMARSRRPTLAEYLEDPNRYPTVSGRPYPNANPMGAVGQAPDLAGAFAEQPDPLGPPMVEAGARDVRTPGMAMSALALPQGAAPPMPADPPPLPERRGLEPLSAPEMQTSDGLDEQWAAAMQRAQMASLRDTGFGMQSPAVRAARGMMPAGMPPPREPGPLMSAMLHSPPARFIRQHSDPAFVAPHLLAADARAATRVPIPGGKPSGARQLIPHKDLAQQQQDRLRTDREGEREDPFRFERDPFSGEIMLETAEERRMREEEERRIQERSQRQGFNVTGRRLEYRRRF